MSIHVTEENIRLEPCDVFWGVRDTKTIETVADSSGSLNDTYFLFSAYNASYVLVNYYLWFNINSAGTDPAIAGKTGIEVTAATDATAAAIATAIVNALGAVSGLTRSVSADTDLVTVVFEQFGLLSDMTDGTAATGFTFASTVAGKGGSLGATSGGIEISFEVGAVDVTADQTGEQLLDRIFNANNISVSMTMQEVTAENLSRLIGSVSGDEFTPNSGTKVIGVGESKRFKNMKQYSGELLLIPVGATDNLRNHTFFKSAPSFESLNFSGADIQQLPVTFNSFRDTAVNNKVNLWAFGDSSQDLSA